MSRSSIAREGGFPNFRLNPAAIMDELRVRRSGTSSPELKAELGSQWEAKSERAVYTCHG